MAGLFAQWMMSSAYAVLPPPGDAYLFVLGCTWTFLSPPFGLQFDQFINDLLPSIILPLGVDQSLYLWGTFVHPFTPRRDVRVGLESTISRVHGGDLVFRRIKRVLGGRSVDPTCPWLPSLRTLTILRE